MGFENNKILKLFRLFNKGFGRFKKQILMLTGLGFFGGILEGIGVNAAIPMFSFVMGKSYQSGNFISGFIEDFFNFFNVRFSFRYLLIFICLLFILRALALIVCNYIRSKIAADYEEETRSQLFLKTLKADWSYLLRQKIGHLETIIMTNVQHSSLLLRQISNIIMTLAGLLIYFFVAINISFNVTIITVALGFFLLVGLKPFVSRIRLISRERENINRQTAHHINENIIGMKTIKAMFVDSEVVKKSREYFKKLKEVVMKLSFLKIITDALMQPISVIFVLIVFAISYKSPNFNFVAMAAVIYLIQRIFDYIKQLQMDFHVISESIPYLEKTIEYEEELEKAVEERNGSLAFDFASVLEFKNVGFSYDRQNNILKELSFSIKKGEMVGLIGPSGAGKTTVVDLILRLFKPISGQILLDGQDIWQTDMHQWRKNIGYVSQDIFLKNDTIAENIRFFDNSLSKKDIVGAAKMANIYDFIESLPEKIETVIGERGILLSAGQRQRIVIARILARRPQFLIFDEATSALDNESEEQIQKVIENLKNKVTVLVIAHRLSTVINSDRLLILGEGKIMEQGNPEYLLKNKESYFYKVYNINKV